MGAADAIAAAGDYALARLRNAPADGVRARVFVEPVWAAYGAQAQAMKALMVAQSGSPGSPVQSATIGKMFDWVIAGIEESNELGIEIGARNGGIDMVVSLLAKVGTALDSFAGQQTPADFSLVSRFADQPSSFLAGGRMNLAGAGGGLIDLIFGGASKDPKLAPQLPDWLRLVSGELAMMGHFTGPAKLEYQYLLKSPEAQKLVAVFPTMIDAMNQNGMLEGMAKISRSPKPNASYDGLTLWQSELSYDLSKMPAAVGEKKFSLASVWTSWDDLVAMATGGNALERAKKLVDAARHGKGAWQPSAAIRASIDRARAAKESVWIRMDLSAMAAASGSKAPTQMPPGITPTIALGCTPHNMWMRVSVPAPPQTAGSL
jgi:hypothetical protein